MVRVLVALATAAAAAFATNEYQKNQLGKELWAKATDNPQPEDIASHN